MGLILLRLIESSGVVVFLVNIHLYNSFSLLFNYSVQLPKSKKDPTDRSPN